MSPHTHTHTLPEQPILLSWRYLRLFCVRRLLITIHCSISRQFNGSIQQGVQIFTNRFHNGFFNAARQLIVCTNATGLKHRSGSIGWRTTTTMYEENLKCNNNSSCSFNLTSVLDPIYLNRASRYSCGAHGPFATAHQAETVACPVAKVVHCLKSH